MSTQTDPWAPYEPTANDPWDLAKVAHLHRRAGFGGTWSELQLDLSEGPAASVDRLLKPRQETSEERQILASLRQGVLDSRDSERLKAWWLYRMLYGADPLREKMTLFWHSHFATSNYKVQNIKLMVTQNDLLRDNALEEVGSLLKGITTDRAMLVWLDGAGSKKEKPNENFAREFLELFTVGLGHYTEADIRQAARAFTGWIQVQEDGDLYGDKFRYLPEQFDNGAKTFLKQTGPWKPADIVRITLEQPAAAEFLCRKLYRHFVSESGQPNADLIAPLAQELRSHDYSIQHVLGIVLRSRHFYDRASIRQRIKSPVEFSIGLLRTLEMPRKNVSLLAAAVTCERQGLDLFYPPNVKGWDGGKSWLNSSTVLERGNWIADILWGNADFGLAPYDPLAWLQRNGISPDKAAQAFVDMLLQGDLSESSHEIIVRTAARDGNIRNLRLALQQILHCPEYQLA
jgi:uncharacterized protein (DUF1800 family)